MKNINFKTQILPHLLVVFAFWLLTAVYFKATITEGKQLKQSDAVQFSGSAQSVKEHRTKYNEEPLWIDNMFGGMPAYTVSVLYKGDVLNYIEQILRLGLPYPINIVLVTLICGYIMLLAFGLKPIEAACGALAYGLFTFVFVSLEAGHNSKLRAMGFAPLVLGSIVLAFRQGKALLALGLMAVGTGLQISAGHYQISYYLFFAGLIFFINEVVLLFKNKNYKPILLAILILAGGVVLGVSANAGRLLVMQEYTPFSMRGAPELVSTDANKPTDGGLDRDYVFAWSNSKAETFTLLIPYFFGGSSNEALVPKSNVAKALSKQGYGIEQLPQVPLYWGEQAFTSGPVYAGAIVCFLFVLGLFLPQNRFRWALLSLFVFSLMMSWGKHFSGFNYFLYDYLPFYNKFRAVTMSLFLAQLALAAGAALALHYLYTLDWVKAQDRKKFFIPLGIVGGLALIFTLFPSLAGSFIGKADEQFREQTWLIDAIRADRKDVLRSDAFRSLFFIVAAAGLVYAYLIKKLPAKFAFSAIAVLIFIDLIIVDRRYINQSSFEKKYLETLYQPSAADNLILADTTQYRVANLQNPFTEAQTSYFHNSIGGYSPAKIRRYQDIIENDLSIEIKTLIDSLQTGRFSPDKLAQFRILNMLNTAYYKFGDAAEQVIKNPYSMGNAWFVGKIQKVNTPDQELAALTTLNPIAVALVDEVKYTVSKTDFDTTGASISLTNYKANHLTYESKNANEGFAVFSEIYYAKGWNVLIDGKSVGAPLRANYVLRAMYIPAGNHKIEFVFSPESYRMGDQVALASSISIYLLLAAGIFFSFKSTKEDNLVG